MKFLAKYWPSIIVLGVILYATLASDPMGADELPAIPHIDKLVHAIMMGGFVGAIAFDKQRADTSRRILTQKLMWKIFAGVAAFALIDELSQSWMDMGRATDPMDFVADIVGALAAIYLAPPAIYKVLKIKRN